MRPCIACGVLVAGASYCKSHEPSRVSPGRGSSTEVRSYRARALERDGHRCRALLPTGERCPVTEGLQIHHLVPLARGGGNGLMNLVTLCRAHHRDFERELRGTDP